MFNSEILPADASSTILYVIHSTFACVEHIKCSNNLQDDLPLKAFAHVKLIWKMFLRRLISQPNRIL